MACLRPAKGADLSAVAQSVATAIELGACPAVIAVDGYASVDLEHLVTTLNRNVPDARVAFNRVAFSLANNAVALAVLETCKRLNVGVVACDPLGNGACVTDATHPEHDVGQVQLLSFLGAMVGPLLDGYLIPSGPRSPARVTAPELFPRLVTTSIFTRQVLSRVHELLTR